MRLFEEITRRRLVQTAALYVAVAWGGTEIVVFLADALLGTVAGDSARRYLAILLIAGFPAAMYLAWTRDLGLKARRLLSAAVVAVVIVGILVVTIPPPSPEKPELMAEDSIAVLPFEVCEERESDRMLAGGLTGEVFNRLAQRDGLKLKGRRSIDALTRSLTSVASVAELLGVRYLLSATVCRDGVDLTLNAELTDHNGFIVWQQEFTEVVNRYDQVEVRLATLVENGVAGHFGDVIPAPGDKAVDRRALVPTRVVARAEQHRLLVVQGGGLILEGLCDTPEDADRRAHAARCVVPVYKGVDRDREIGLPGDQ